MQINTDGLIILERDVGESDRLITILTRDEGVIRAFAQKAKTIKNAKASSTQLLCYSRLSIYKGRDKYIVDDAQPIEVFFGLRKNIQRLALAQYFCELAGALAPEESRAEDYLRLMLNALYFLSKGSRDELLLKSVVEMRMLSLSGYMPNLICCEGCNCYEADSMFFLPRSGILLCGECNKTRKEVGIRLSPGVLTGLRHTVYAEFDRLFSFQLKPEGFKQLNVATESFLLSQLERRFASLEFIIL